MISRRLLRIKVLQVLYAYFQTSESSINKTEKELFFSIQKSYDLYHLMLSLVLDIAKLSESKIEIAKQKHFPTSEELNPNTRFLQNKLIAQLQENEHLNKYIDSNKLSWVNYPELIKGFFYELLETDFYKTYMALPKSNYSLDKKLIADIFENIIVKSESLSQVLEEQSIYWNDDAEFITSMILKTIESFKIGQTKEQTLMPLFKNEADVEFVKILVRKTILKHSDYMKLIEENVKNWDIERIAFTDVIIIQLAITEIMEFPSIPTKVTFNEYIEISKFYSTPKSSTFINGILDKIINKLKTENQVRKTGRGLLEKTRPEV